MLPLQTKITDISGLQSALAFWEHVDYCATFVVFVGVLGELLAEFTNVFKTQADKSRKDRATMIATVILLVGLGVEIPALIRTSTLTGKITEVLRDDIASAYSTAGSAIVEGARANERAKRLEGENSRLRIELERETTTRLAFEKQVLTNVDNFLTPRILTAKQKTELKEYLLRHQPVGRVTIQYLANSPEAEAYATQLRDAFKEAGWETLLTDESLPKDSRRLVPPRFPGAACEENGPITYKRSDAEWRALTILCGALTAAHVSSWEVWNPGTTYRLYVYIGARPLRLPAASPKVSRLAKR